ncbi:hypothetical protein V1264_014426 [Littorina saxatilis]|uniref:Uncharacterized protein n=1 Tax=Littorina saxatilis TaxID=31220 RepID=A0AAN9BS05_9CAEN
MSQESREAPTTTSSTLGDRKFESSQSSSQNGTINSSVDLPFDANTWLDVKTKLESIAWIQCDDQKCLKWRKLPREEVERISETEKWFCCQNSDPNFSSCEVPEEDVELYDQLALRSGLKYLKSQLVQGTLVWAKMPGYCSWPAVVTSEPGTDNGHLWKDEEDEIIQYHVEFLGPPHSHGWVFARDVVNFTAKSVSKQLTRDSHKEGGQRGRSKAKSRRKTMCSGMGSKVKTTYKSGLSVHDGVDEAMTLLPMSPIERLKRCIYVSRGKPEHGSYSTEPTVTTASSRKVAKKKKRETRKTATTDSGSAITPTPHYTAFDTALQNRSKEERLMLDVEMYKRNERAFEHDVTRFLIRNDLKTCKGPIWQNQNVSIFQLFLAVHERGGYTQVTHHRGWAAVYREVTDMSCSTEPKNSQAAKHFYHRYLYPYELYIRGHDFREFVQPTDGGNGMDVNKKGKCSVHKEQKIKRCSKTQENQKQPCADGGNAELEEDIASDSLREMLQALEENSRLAFDDVELEYGIGVTFYDESTPPNSKDHALPLTAYEQQASPPQVVPSQILSVTKLDSSAESSIGACQFLQQLENAGKVCSDSGEEHKAPGANRTQNHLHEEKREDDVENHYLENEQGMEASLHHLPSVHRLEGFSFGSNVLKQHLNNCTGPDQGREVHHQGEMQREDVRHGSGFNDQQLNGDTDEQASNVHQQIGRRKEGLLHASGSSEQQLKDDAGEQGKEIRHLKVPRWEDVPRPPALQPQHRKDHTGELERDYHRHREDLPGPSALQPQHLNDDQDGLKMENHHLNGQAKKPFLCSLDDSQYQIVPRATVEEEKSKDGHSSVSAFSQFLDQLDALQEGIDLIDAQT